MTKNELYDIENYTILMQYLAIGEKITINNGFADIEIWMEDGYKIKALNLHFPTLSPYKYDNEMTLENVLLGIIPALKNQKPKEYESFENRWEEIKALSLSTVALNKMKE